MEGAMGARWRASVTTGRALLRSVKVLTALLALFGSAVSKPSPRWRTAAVASTNADLRQSGGDVDKVNVHIVAHTHDDVGWKKTVDEYFYGSNKTIADGAVQDVLDTVIPELLNDPQKRFIYVEMAFFFRWWREQDNTTRAKVIDLVAQGRLEFINGGWCMNDEAGTHYNAIIDQMTLGHSFISTTFGAHARPRVAWQIDPFGHSSTQAALFADMGFDGLYFARADYEDKALRINQSRLEMVWRGSPKNRRQESDLFTGMFWAGYGPPQQFCFDERCPNPAVMQDDELLDDYNAKMLVNSFINITMIYAKAHRTNHIMMPMGSDFQFGNAHQHFRNIDKLLKYVAADGRVNIFYSTPSQYLDVVNQAGLEWELKTDDFFPYADRPHAYWTGYFTSRPALKRYVRTRNSLLQTCKQIESLNVLQPGPTEMKSSALREAMGVAQHHDAVSGTEQQHVADNYAKRLAVGSANCQTFLADWASGGSSANSFFSCDLLNVTVCPQLTNGQPRPFGVFVYNPLAHRRNVTIRVPVSHTLFDVSEGVQYQTVPVSDGTMHVRGNRSNATHELVMMTNVDATAAKLIQVKPTEDGVQKLVEADTNDSIGDVTISNEYLQLSFSAAGHLSQIKRLDNEMSVDVNQQFLWYQSFNGTKKDKQASGAYIFRPANDTAFPVNDEGNKATISTVKGDLVQEVRQKFSPWIYQTVRLYKGQKHVELEFTVGPIPVSDKLGKEVVSRFDTNLKTNGVFYTDANGREMQKRQRDYRPTWQPNMTVFEHVAGNYYPVNSRIYLQDETAKAQLIVLTDSSQGGASIADGSMELMVHRRLLVDDHRGVDEPLNEPGYDHKGLIIRGKHLLVLSPIMEAASIHRPLAQEIMLEPLVLFQNNKTEGKHSPKEVVPASLLTNELPPNVHLLTLQTLDFGATADSSLLIRLEHYFEVGEDEMLSQPATINLTHLFSPAFNVISVQEMTLTGNQLKSEEKRLQWKVMGEEVEDGFSQARAKTVNRRSISDEIVIDLQPMQIRTFILKVNSP